MGIIINKHASHSTNTQEENLFITTVGDDWVIAIRGEKMYKRIIMVVNLRVGGFYQEGFGFRL